MKNSIKVFITLVFVVVLGVVIFNIYNIIYAKYHMPGKEEISNAKIKVIYSLPKNNNTSGENIINNYWFGLNTIESKGLFADMKKELINMRARAGSYPSEQIIFYNNKNQEILNMYVKRDANLISLPNNDYKVDKSFFDTLDRLESKYMK